MAELIPLEYRIEVARKRLIERWMIVGVLAAAVATAGLATAFAWQRERAQELAAEKVEFEKVSDLIKEARNIERKRQELAGQMQKLQGLRDDTVLMSLLKSVTESVSDSDCLSLIQIEAHTADKGRGKEESAAYRVRLQGLTNNDSTHSKFLERLSENGKKTHPPLSVPLGEKQLRLILDKEVTFFDITCEPPASKAR